MQLQSIILSFSILVAFLQNYPSRAQDISTENHQGFYSSISISTPSIIPDKPPSPTDTPTPIQNTTPKPTPSARPGKQTGLSKSIASKTPHPSSTSTNIPPADPNLARLIIGAGILIVLVVILGVWINRYRLR